MTKSTDVVALTGLVTGFTVLTVAFVAGSYLLTGWVGDIVYSNIFEQQEIGPTISFWQWVGVAVVCKSLFRGFELPAGTGKKSD